MGNPEDPWLGLDRAISFRKGCVPEQPSQPAFSDRGRSHVEDSMFDAETKCQNCKIAVEFPETLKPLIIAHLRFLCAKFAIIKDPEYKKLNPDVKETDLSAIYQIALQVKENEMARLFQVSEPDQYSQDQRDFLDLTENIAWSIYSLSRGDTDITTMRTRLCPLKDKLDFMFDQLIANSATK